MGNIDALFSTRAFKSGEVVFTEKEFAQIASSDGASLAVCAPESANCDVVRYVVYTLFIYPVSCVSCFF